MSIKELRDYYKANKDKTSENYTEESFAAYTEALNAAAEILEKADASQTDVDQALADLQAAVDGLDEKEPAAVNKEALQNLYDSYAKMEQGNYTDESWQVLQDALADANAVLEKADATQTEVDEAYSVLQSSRRRSAGSSDSRRR